MFVDECHRTRSGKLHQAMKQLLPNAVYIGFTGTPLLRADKHLCTPRSRGHLWTTQHSVPAGGQPLPGRTLTCRVA